MKTKEELERIIHHLLKEYYFAPSQRGDRENFYLIGFVRGMQYTIGMDIKSGKNIPEWFKELLESIETGQKKIF